MSTLVDFPIYHQKLSLFNFFRTVVICSFHYSSPTSLPHSLLVIELSCTVLYFIILLHSTQLYPVGFCCIRQEHDVMLDRLVDVMCEVDAVFEAEPGKFPSFYSHIFRFSLSSLSYHISVPPIFFISSP